MIKRLLLIFLLLPIVAFADTPRGEKLLERLWKDMQEGQVKKIARYTSDEFQGAWHHGFTTKKQMLHFLKHYKISNYRLSDVQTTQGKNIITVTYRAWVSATFEENTPKLPEEGFRSWRLAVWKKVGDKWKWVADAKIEEPPLLL